MCACDRQDKDGHDSLLSDLLTALNMEASLVSAPPSLRKALASFDSTQVGQALSIIRSMDLHCELLYDGDLLVVVQAKKYGKGAGELVERLLALQVCLDGAC